jgi:hypothetical protein
VTDSELILIGESLRDASVAISDVIDATPNIEQPPQLLSNQGQQ